MAGITKDVSIHSLRHAFSTHLLEDGATLLQVKELLGHSSIQSTPFKNAGCVVEYLGRYTHRVAISNNRILKLV